MASKTRYSVCRPRHISQPRSTSVCVRQVGSVKTGIRSCKSAAREGIICHMEGTSLSLGGCVNHRLLPRVYKESPPRFCRKICESSESPKPPTSILPPPNHQDSHS